MLCVFVTRCEVQKAPPPALYPKRGTHVRLPLDKRPEGQGRGYIIISPEEGAEREVSYEPERITG